MLSSACCDRRPPRTFLYFVPAGLALLSSLLVLLVYVPATSVFLLQAQLLHSAQHQNPPGSSGSPTRANNSVVDSALGSVPSMQSSAASGKAPPFQAEVEGGRDERAWLKGQGPSGNQRKGNNIRSEVFHDKEYFLEGYKQMNRSFKIFVYPHYKDDPFAHALLPVDFQPGGNYASESYFKKVLMQSHFVTRDPSEADLFFLPFSIARLRHDHRVDVGGIAGFVQMYIFNVSQKYPYWNRTGGADHFYVACHSTGRSAMEKTEELKFNAIQVVCSASYFLSGYVAHKDVCLPQIWPRTGTPAGVFTTKRGKLAFFAGSMNSPVREKLIEAWKNDSEISVHHGRLSTPYSEGLLSSKFCLHVKGFEVNTARIADAIYYGCVPVIIANHYDLPFSGVLNWKSFSVVVPTLDIPLLKEILRGVSSDRYRLLHKNVLKGFYPFFLLLSPTFLSSRKMILSSLWMHGTNLYVYQQATKENERETLFQGVLSWLGRHIILPCTISALYLLFLIGYTDSSRYLQTMTPLNRASVAWGAQILNVKFLLNVVHSGWLEWNQMHCISCQGCHRFKTLWSVRSCGNWPECVRVLNIRLSRRSAERGTPRMAIRTVRMRTHVPTISPNHVFVNKFSSILHVQDRNLATT